jgi:hypothetical protein
LNVEESDVAWERLVGWQLLVFGAAWVAAITWWGDDSAAVLAQVPRVADLVLGDSSLARAWHAAPFVPGALAIALGVYCMWDARRVRRPVWVDAR